MQTVVARGSPLVGHSVIGTRFRSEYGGAVIAIQRAVLRSVYLRALRLEERYAADAAIRALEELAAQVGGNEVPQWLMTERDKLYRTKAGRERGDELFCVADFDLAAAMYAAFWH